MAFTLVAVVAAIATSLLRGGRLGAIADREVGRFGLLITGAVLQVAAVVAIRALELGPGIAGLLLVGSTVPILLWILVHAWVPGAALVLLGLVANALVIGLNGGMPVSGEAAAVAGLSGTPPAGEHVPLTAETVLPALADVIPVPPIRSVISVGDILLAAGLFPLANHLLGGRRLRPRTPVAD